jgi:hypothetical protein
MLRIFFNLMIRAHSSFDTSLRKLSFRMSMDALEICIATSHALEGGDGYEKT